MTGTLLIAGVGVLLLAACGGSPTPTPTRTLPLTATAIPEQTPTPTLATVSTATAIPVQTATPTLAAVSTPTPVPVPPRTPTASPGPSGPPPLPEAGLVTIANTQFIVDIADDDAERRRGLSGRESLDPDGGMWFVRERELIGSFWMRGMKFPIDIIWIGSDLRVVDVTHSAPVPPAGATDSELPRYSPQAPAAFVLEINAGLAEQLGISRRVAVEFSRF